FKDVYFTGLIRDSQGRKMSKSLDNGIDPIEVIEEYGADALRCNLITGNTPGNDMRLYMERVEANRNFANKLWNATRFVFMNLKEDKLKNIDEVKLETEDRWIISRINTVAKEVQEAFDKFEIGLAAGKLYDFIWNEFCDWYIELVKPRLYNDDEDRNIAAQSTLNYSLMAIIKLLHPFMPYITEEIYSFMPNKKDMLINEDWVRYDENLVFTEDENKIKVMIDAVTAIRNARAEMDIAPSKKSKLIFVTEDENTRNTLEELSMDFKTLASCNEIEFMTNDIDEIEDSISIVQNKFKIFIPLEGLIDYAKELDRLEKDYKKVISEIKRAEGKLANEKFVNKAPEKLVQEERDKLVKYKEMLDEVEGDIKNIKDKM